MKNKYKIGIAIAAYNEEVHLPLLLDAIFQQKGVENVIKIAVVDSNSTDNTASIIKKYESINPVVKYLLNPKKITPISMSMGFEECMTAGADIIVNLVAHGAISTDFFYQLNILASTKKDVHIFNASLDFLPPQNIVEEVNQVFALSRIGRNWKKHYKMKEPVDGPSGGIICVRREVIEKIGYFDEMLVRNQDIDFVTRAIKAGFKAQTVPEIVFAFRVRQTVLAHHQQMYRTGLYISRGAKNLKLMHKIPGLFYAMLLLLLIVGVTGLIVGSEIMTMSGFLVLSTVLSVYLIAVLFSAVTIKNVSPGVRLRFVRTVITSHFAYGMGTLIGAIKRL